MQTMEIKNNKPRLEWVDTAKGICILLVILYHTTGHLIDVHSQMAIMLRATRMPLYFTIAGLFVSIKSISTFIEKNSIDLLYLFVFLSLLGMFLDIFTICFGMKTFIIFLHYTLHIQKTKIGYS